MELDTEAELLRAIRQGLAEGIKSKITSYNSPLDKMIETCVSGHGETLRKLLNESMTAAVADEGFRTQIREAVHHKLAKTLIDRFGGELEKQVNVLKSDPSTRARITLAIEEIVKEKVAS